VDLRFQTTLDRLGVSRFADALQRGSRLSPQVPAAIAQPVQAAMTNHPKREMAWVTSSDSVTRVPVRTFRLDDDHAQAEALLETVDVDDPSLPVKLRRIFALCRAARFADCGSSRADCVRR
jgi:hypothetical protein